MSSEPKIKTYLADEAIIYMRLHIRDAGGNEVFFSAKPSRAQPTGRAWADRRKSWRAAIKMWNEI